MTLSESRQWNTRAQYVRALGTVYGVTLGFFVVLSMMFVTLIGQVQQPIKTEAAVCSLPGSVTTTIELTPDNADNVIDCSGQDITVTATGKLILKNYKTSNTSPTDDGGVLLKVGNLTIEAGGEVSADGQGYIASATDGGSATASTGFAGGSGGGHGGAGGTGNTSGGTGNDVGATGESIGNKDYPLTLGGAGGNAGGGGAGGVGGGAIKIEASGTVTIDGKITANGTSGVKSGDNQTSGGGGAGGSIWVQAQILAGSGQVTAQGGGTDNTASYFGGGGGGGRVALICTASTTFPAGNASVAFGTGSQNGSVGTLVGPGCKPAEPTVMRFFEKNASAGLVDRELEVGEYTTKTALTFASNLDGSNLKLEIELRETNQQFTNTPTAAEVASASNKTCTDIPNSNSVTISAYCGYVEVASGFTFSTEYKWQARIVSTAGIASDWVQFGGNSSSVTDFTVVGAPASLAIVEGNNQSVVVGQLASPKPKVRVIDAAGYPVPFYPLSAWAVLTGGGAVSNSVLTADKWGILTTDWTMGTVAGSNNNTLQVYRDGTGLTATFTATALPGAIASYSVVSGTNLSLVNTPFTYTVTAKDAYNNSVAFTNNLSVVPVSSHDTGVPGLGTLSPDTLTVDTGENSMTVSSSEYSYTESIKVKVYDSNGKYGFSSSILFVDAVGSCPSVTIDINQTWNAIDVPGGIFDCRGLGQFTVKEGYTLSLRSYSNGDSNYTNDFGVTLLVDSLKVENNGIVSAEGLGYAAGAGVASGLHAGYQSGIGTAPYGDLYEPVSLGSGMMRSYANWTTTGAGGGAIKISVTGNSEINGVVSTNGADGTNGEASDGGAGGSIWLDTQAISGTGYLKANGGAGRAGVFSENYGGGTGGRLAVYYTTNNGFTLDATHLQSYGNRSGAGYSGAGTVYVENKGVDSVKGGTLIVDNNNHNGLFAGVVEGSYQLKKIQVTRYGHVEFIGQAGVLNIVSGEGMVGDSTKPQIKVSGTLQYSSQARLTIDGVDLGINGKAIGIQDVTIGGANPAGVTLYANTWFHNNSNGYTLGDVVITGNGMLSAVAYQNGASTYTDDYGVRVDTAGLTIQSGGKLTADGLGYPIYVGVASGVHGGYQKSVATLPYGDIYEPVTLGSGMTRSYANWTNTGYGGGALKLNISGTASINGTLSANGTAAVNGEAADGAAGGSIWLTTNTLTGSGYIQANGGTGKAGYGSETLGGGSGGRIAVYYNTNTDFPLANIQAYGAGLNNDTNYSGAGTIYIEDKAVDSVKGGLLIVDNNGKSGNFAGVIEGTYQLKKIQATRYGHVEFLGQNGILNLVSGQGMVGDNTKPQIKVSGTLQYSGSGVLTIDGVDLGINGKTVGIQDITIGGANPAGVTMYAKTWFHSNVNPYSFGDLLVTGNGILTMVGYQNGTSSIADDFGVVLNMTGLTVQAGGLITADGLGYPIYVGVASGVHGGYQKSVATLPYGDIYEPVTLGSGMTRSYANWTNTGYGGGAMKLTVSGTTTINGIVTASGTAAVNGEAADGAAGGSVWLDTQTLTGSGYIKANGGSGKAGYGSESLGGGSGGRIAVYYGTNTNFAISNIQAYGAGLNNNTNYSGAGTIYIENKGVDVAKKGTLIVDNNNNNGNFSGVPEGNYQLKEIQVKRYGHVEFIGQGSLVNLPSGQVFVGDSTKPQIKISGTIEYSGEGRLTLDGVDLGINGKAVGIQDLTIGGTNAAGLTLYAKTWFHSNVNPYVFADVVVSSNGIMSMPSFQNGTTSITDDFGVNLQMTGLTVNSGGLITGDGLGYPIYVGVASGVHGGYQQSVATLPYGDIYEPVTLGSGMMRSYANWTNTGYGGAAMKLTVSGTTTINGIITSSGTAAVNGEAADGAAGGSIWLDTATLAGSGFIKANGGSGKAGYGSGSLGGGSGGRIAVYYGINTDFAISNIQAYGAGLNNNTNYSGAGTIYIENEGVDVAKKGMLIVDNNNHSGNFSGVPEGTYQLKKVQATRYGNVEFIGQNNVVEVADANDMVGDSTKPQIKFSGTLQYTGTNRLVVDGLNLGINGKVIGIQDFTVGGINSAEVTLYAKTWFHSNVNPYTFGDVLVKNNGLFTMNSYVKNGGTDPTDDYGVSVTLTGLTVEASGKINADGLGYPVGVGVGSGLHAGYQFNLATAPYGNIYEPTSLGSGVMRSYAGWTSTGAGGGGIKLTVSGATQLDGTLSANGMNAVDGEASDAGAGGSIWLDTQTLSGTGTIKVNGGIGRMGYSGGSYGGGAGGRIAVYFDINNGFTLDSTRVQAIGGAGGGAYSGPGTIYIEDRTRDSVHEGDLTIQNAAHAGRAQDFGSGTYKFHNVTIGQNVTLWIKSDPTAVVEPLGVTAPHSILPDSSTLLSYKFDDTTTTSYSDASGKGKVLTAGSKVFAVPGKFGNAQKIASGEVGLTFPGIELPGDWSMDMWLRFPLASTPDGWRTIVHYNGTSYHNIIVHQNGQLGAYNYGWYDSGYNVNSLSGWHHLAVTASGSTTKYYIDGQQVGSIGIAMHTPINVIGNAGVNQNTGVLDEVRIQDVAMSASEVQAAAATVEPYTSNENTLALWHLDEDIFARADSSSDSKIVTNYSTVNTVEGKFGSARNFSASGQVMLTENVPLTGDWTIDLWASFPLPASNGGWRSIVATSSGNYHQVMVHSSGNLGTYNGGWYDTGYNLNALTGWHHVAAVGSGNSTVFYIDGVNVGSVATKVVQPISAVGNYAAGGWDLFAGKLDEVRVRSRALSVGEVLQDAGATEAPVADETTQLLLHFEPYSNAKTIADASASNLTGTLFGTAQASGKFDSARLFTGIRDYVQVPSSTMDFTGGMTISLWAKPTASGNYARFVDFGNGCPSDNVIFYREGTGNDLIFIVYRGGSYTTYVRASGGIINNEWHHYLATLDSLGNGKIYRDGVVIGTGTTSIPNTVQRTLNYVGKSCSGSDALYAGYMDELHIFNRNFTDEQVQAITRGYTDAEYITYQNKLVGQGVRFELTGNFSLATGASILGTGVGFGSDNGQGRGGRGSGYSGGGGGANGGSGGQGQTDGSHEPAVGGIKFGDQLLPLTLGAGGGSSGIGALGGNGGGAFGVIARGVLNNQGQYEDGDITIAGTINMSGTIGKTGSPGGGGGAGGSILLHGNTCDVSGNLTAQGGEGGNSDIDGGGGGGGRVSVLYNVGPCSVSGTVSVQEGTPSDPLNYSGQVGQVGTYPPEPNSVPWPSQYRDQFELIEEVQGANSVSTRLAMKTAEEPDVLGTTESAIPVGGIINGTTVTLKADAYDAGARQISPKRLKIQVEIKKANEDFTGTTNVYDSGDVLFAGGTPVVLSVTIDNLEMGASYKWRVRTANLDTGLFSDWREFGGNNLNAADFTITTVSALDITPNKVSMELPDSASITVTAKDSLGATDTSYRGTVTFTSSSGTAQLPQSYTFNGGDSGVHTFTNALKFFEAGTFSVTVEDTVNPILVDSAMITITIPPVPYISLSSSIDTLVVGETATLTWESGYLTDVSIDQGIGVVDATGNRDVVPVLGDTTYTIQGRQNNGDYISASVTITAVTPDVPFIVFNASETDVLIGQSVTLQWSTGFLTEVSINEGIGSVNASGSQSITPPLGSTIYTLQGRKGDGSLMSESITISAIIPEIPFITFSTSESTVVVGQMVTLQWETGFLTDVSINQGVGVVDILGSRVVTPQAGSTTYTLQGRKSNGDYMSESLTVLAVSANIPYLSFTVSDASITVGSTVTLHWRSNLLSNLSINQGVGSVATSGNTPVTPPLGITRYTIQGEDGEGNTVSASVSVIAISPIVTVLSSPYIALTASTKSVIYGESFELHWQSAFLSNLSINQGIGTVAIAGRMKITPPLGSTTYTIVGQKRDGQLLRASVTVNASKKKVVTAEVSCPIISVFTVSNRIIKIGDTVAINWQVQNADKISIDSFSGALAKSGAASIVLGRTQDVTIYASKGSCERTQSLHVDVVNSYPWEGAGGMLIGLLAIETVGMQIGVTQGNLWFALLGLIDRSKKRKPWGVVYNSVTKALLARVVVRLWNAESGKLVDTVVTDANGIFKLTPKVGRYVVKVSLAGYIFPSKLINNSTDTGFTNIYTGEVIEIRDDSEMLMISIPMDPEKKQNKGLRVQQVMNFLEELVGVISPIILISGFIYSVVVTLMYPMPFNYLILSLYALTFLVKAYVYLSRPKLFGLVTGIDGKTVSGLEIGLFDHEFNNLISRTFTNKQGAYNFVVKNQEYYLQILDPGFKILSRHVEKNGVLIKKSSGNSGVKLVTESLVVYPVKSLAKK